MSHDSGRLHDATARRDAVRQEIEARLHSALPELLPQDDPAARAAFSRQLASAWPVPDVPQGLAERIGARLTSVPEVLTPMGGRREKPSSWYTRLRHPVALVIAGAGLVAVIGVSLWHSTGASAQEIVRRTVASYAGRGVHSLMLDETMSNWPRAGSPEQIRHVQLWFQAPHEWRQQVTYNAPDGQVVHQVMVSDGKDEWRYDSTSQSVSIDSAAPGAFVGIVPTAERFGVQITDWGQVLSGSGRCARAASRASSGAPLIAGRPTYVVRLAAATACQSADAPDFNGPITLWIDRQTYLVLRADRFSPDGRLVEREVATAVQYNQALDASLFHLATPAGATVHDNRPRPLPSGSELSQALAHIAGEAPFPVFVPATPPPSLRATEPTYDSKLGVRLGYTDTSSPASPGSASRDGLWITEHRAEAWQIAQLTANEHVQTPLREDPLAIGSWKAWFKQGGPGPNGIGASSSNLTLVRDGTLIGLGSFALGRDELIAIAKSMEPLPGTHAPLATPTQPTLEQIRQSATFHVLLPSYLPPGVTQDTTVAPTRTGTNVVVNLDITYGTDGQITMRLHESDGSIVPQLPQPMQNGKDVAIRPGLTGKYLDIQPQFGGPILWWVQDGTYVALSSSSLSEQELIRVAAGVQ